MVSASLPPVAGKGLVQLLISDPCAWPGGTLAIAPAGTFPAEPSPTR